MQKFEAERRNLWKMAVLLFPPGVFWFGLESWLRGGTEKIVLHPSVVLLLTLLSIVVGLGIRVRSTMAGEFEVAREIGSMAMVAIFTLPAAMLVVYLAAFVLSIVWAACFWVLYVFLVLLAVIVQLAVFAAVVGGIILGVGASSDDHSVVAGAVGGVVGLLPALLLSHFAEIRFIDSFNFEIVRLAIRNDGWIPSWDRVFRALREDTPLAAIPHGAVVSIVLSTLVGLLVGLAAALGVRFLRQQLMNYPSLRPFLPFAAAPLQDTEPVIAPALLFPLAVYLLISWLAALYLTVALTQPGS